MVKFDVSYGFKIFDENFNDLKPVELIGNEHKTRDPIFLFPGVEGR